MSKVTSPMFEIATEVDLNTLRDYRIQNKKNTVGGIALSCVNICNIKPYTWAILQLGLEKFSKCGMAPSTRRISDVVLVAQRAGRDSIHGRAEKEVLEEARKIKINSTDTLAIDAAIIHTIAEVSNEYRNDETKILDREKINSMLARNLSCFGIRSESSSGVVFSPIGYSHVPTLGESTAYSMAASEKPYSSLLILASLMNSKSLSGLWPVDYPKDIYKSAIGISGLAGDTQGSESKPVEWGDIAKNLSAQAGKSAIELLDKFGKAKIEQADKETKIYIESKYKQAYGKAPSSDSDLEEWASNNPEEAKEATYKAYEKQGISKSELNQILEAAKPKQVNWPLIAGVGVGSLLAVGLLALAISRR